MGTIKGGYKWSGAKINGYTVNGTYQNGNKFYQKEIPIVLDTDTQNFVTAAGITDSTQKSALDYLVTELKNEGMWGKISALYPLVGGTAFTHKFNLKDPLDSDSSYRLVFNGTTHTSNGFQSGSVNTFCILTPNNSSYTIYSRTSGIGSDIILTGMGSTRVYLRYDGSWFSSFMRNDYFYSTYSVADSLGIYTENSSGSNSSFFKNGTLLFNGSNGNGLTVVNSALQVTPTNTNVAFLCFGTALTNSESVTLSNIVQQFQTILGRNV